MKTAALIVIGDEILTGKVKDENTFVFAKTMFNQGVRVPRVIVIPDDIALIAETVSDFAGHYDYVCTSGGVGPTHDDKTYEGIAQAFKRPLAQHQVVRDYFLRAQERAGRGNAIAPPQMKMLVLPSPCEVYFLEPMWMPLVQVENVFVYPGVPSLFERYMTGLAHLFKGDQFFRQIIFTDRTEVAIADDLGRLQDEFSAVAIGSYPQIPKQNYHVMVTVEGTSEAEVLQVTRELMVLIDGRLNN